MTVPAYRVPTSAVWRWIPCADSTRAMVTSPSPKTTALKTAPSPATTPTLTAKTRIRWGVASRTGMMVRCRNSLPDARMPRMSMTTQVTAPNLSIW